jgi:hypothetical protein
LPNPGAASPTDLVGLSPMPGVTNEGASATSHPGSKEDTGSLSSSLTPPSNLGNLPPSSPALGRLDQGWRGDRGDSARGNRVEGGTGIAGLARAAANALNRMRDQDGGSPLEADQLAESLPFDPETLDQAIAQYLDQIDEVGGVLAELLGSDRLLPWLEGAALASAASIVARRWHRRPSDSSPSEDGEEATPSWFFGLGPEES